MRSVSRTLKSCRSPEQHFTPVHTSHTRHRANHRHIMSESLSDSPAAESPALYQTDHKNTLLSLGTWIISACVCDSVIIYTISFCEWIKSWVNHLSDSLQASWFILWFTLSESPRWWARTRLCVLWGLVDELHVIVGIHSEIETPWQWMHLVGHLVRALKKNSLNAV